MNRTTVFIMEDDEEFSQLLKLRFEADGYEVLTAKNGDEALRSIAIHLPDTVILDIFVPDMDGLTVLKRLKSPIDIETGKPSLTKNIPIIVLTGKAPMVENMVRLEGADDFFVKPLDVERLVNRVNELLEQAKHEKRKRPQKNSFG